MTAIELLDFLGFIIHPNNSFFKPKQNITFLELNINSRDMKISLTRKKRHYGFLIRLYKIQGKP